MGGGGERGGGGGGGLLVKAINTANEKFEKQGGETGRQSYRVEGRERGQSNRQTD